MTSTRRAPSTRAALLASAAGLVLAACGSTSGPDDAVAQQPAAEAAAAGPDTAAGTSQSEPEASSVEPGDAVVPTAFIGATTVDGAAFDAESLKGRPTVAWFWAPWCTVCRGEAPDVAQVVAEYSDRVNFVGVAGRGESPEMRAFVTETGVEAFTHLDDSTGDIWLAYEIFAQPAFAFITADGRVETFTGGLGAEDLASVVDQLIAA